MHSFQCWGTSRSGSRCRVRTIRRFPYCWIHLRKYYSLAVRPSSIDGFGLGLFYVGKVNKRRGDFVAHYSGPERKTQHDIDVEYGNDHQVAKYAYCTSDENCVDSADPSKSDVGRYINSPHGTTKHANVRFSKVYHFANLASRRKELQAARTTPTAYGLSIIATRPIRPGDELFIAYGPAYNFAAAQPS